MPIPPNQCVRLRQKSIEYGSISTFVMIEDPVVENPEVDSKNASIKFGIAPLIRYGNAPKTEKTIHDKVTARYPSLLLNFLVSAFLEIQYNSPDNETVIAADKRNGYDGSL
jgi:hypothetical protein